jgi:hypothetical protein
MPDQEPPLLDPHDVLQVAFLVEQKEAEKDGLETLQNDLRREGRTALGQLSIEWRGPMGDKGFLTTGYLLTRRRWRTKQLACTQTHSQVRLRNIDLWKAPDGPSYPLKHMVKYYWLISSLNLNKTRIWLLTSLSVKATIRAVGLLGLIREINRGIPWNGLVCFGG